MQTIQPADTRHTTHTNNHQPNDSFSRGPFQWTHPGKCPERAYQGDAGHDLFSPIHTTIKPHDIACIDTLVQVTFPHGWFGLVQERGSQSRNKIFCIGNVIDEGFTGTIHVMLANLNDRPHRIQQHDKIGQLLIVPRWVDPIEHFLPTRGTNKLGSSGDRSTGWTTHANREA